MASQSTTVGLNETGDATAAQSGAPHSTMAYPTTTLRQISLWGMMVTVLSIPTAAQAALLDIGGLRFSEVSGDFQITGGRVDADAFTVEQEVYGPNVNLFMAIDNFYSLCPARNDGGCLFRLQTVVTNRSGTPWTFFDHELQETYGIPSPEEDGLSFAQGIPEARPFTASRFGAVDEVTDVRDFVNFSGGVVAPGETVVFRYFISDTTPRDRFYLLERPNFQPGVGFIDPTPRPSPDPVVSLPPVETPVEPVVEPTPSLPTPDPVPDPVIDPPPVTDPGNSAAVPEPSTVLGVLLFGAIAGRFKFKRQS